MEKKEENTLKKEKSNRGGSRPGAGHPFKVKGCPTKVMRVPRYLAKEVELFIRMQQDWINSADFEKYYDMDEARRRVVFSNDLECIIKDEKQRFKKFMELQQENGTGNE